MVLQALARPSFSKDKQDGLIMSGPDDLASTCNIILLNSASKCILQGP